MTTTINLELTAAEAEFAHGILDAAVRFDGQLEPLSIEEVVLADSVVGKLGAALDDIDDDE